MKYCIGSLFAILACKGEDNPKFNQPTDNLPSTEPSDDPDNEGEGSLRFIALGDAGTGSDAQYQVAEAIETVCGVRGCDFVLYLGDNFYETGVTGLDDIQFQEKFELPYAGLDLPFYSVLGNHDYGLLNSIDTPDPQVAYTEVSEKWNMPARYHSHEFSHAMFLGIDSNAIMWDDLWEGAEAQAQWVQETIDNSSKHWKIAYGHHPYLSNGSHGTAGNYDGLPDTVLLSGKDIKSFVQENFCGKIDVYFSGHDHDLQWLEPSCGVEFIVSGAGAKQRSNGNWGAPTIFEQYEVNGFVWVEIVDSQLTAVFYDSAASILYEGMIEK